MIRGLFNILVRLLPAYSLWFLTSFHHPVFDVLYLEHLFLVDSPCYSGDGWRWMLAATGSLPYLLGWDVHYNISDLPQAASWCCQENKVAVDEPLIKTTFSSLGKLREHDQPQGWNPFHSNIPSVDPVFPLINLLLRFRPFVPVGLHFPHLLGLLPLICISFHNHSSQSLQISFTEQKTVAHSSLVSLDRGREAHCVVYSLQGLGES